MQKLSTLKKEKKHQSLKKLRQSSSTDTAFKSKKIKILFQKGVQEKLDDVHLNYTLKLNEKLSSIFQQNDNIRRISADSLLDIARSYPIIMYENIDRVLSTTSSCWIDSDMHVRKAIYSMTLELLKSKSNGIITPFSEIIFMQIRGTLSHIRNEVRIDGLTFLNEYLSIEFGKYKEKFISLNYLLGWSPLVCRISQTANIYNSLDSLYIITVTIREIINQILIRLRKLTDCELDRMNHFELNNSISQLYDSLIHISFEIISKREQTFIDHISLSGMNLIQNQKKMKNENCSSIRIKRSLLPNIPVFVLNDREYILSFLTSIILDTLYSISKYGENFIKESKQLSKICNSIKNIQLDLKDDTILTHSDHSNSSIFYIEKLLLLRVCSLPTFFLTGNFKENINQIIQDYLSILKYFKMQSDNESELLFNFCCSELFEFIFLEGVEMMYLCSINLNSLRKFFTPSKYILFYLLSIILDINSSLNQANINEFDINEIKCNEFFDQGFNFITFEFTDKNIISSSEIFNFLLLHTAKNMENIVNENGKLTIVALKIVLFLPIILGNIGYPQNYYFDHDSSIWSPIEHILVSTIERINLKYTSTPLKNDIILAKYWISIIPKLIFFLYYSTVDEGKQCPTSLICNLLLILKDYIMKKMPIQLEDNSLSLNICKSIMPFFINKKQSSLQNSIVTTLPFHFQKSIISTLPFWPYLPRKFLLSIIRQILSFIKNRTNLLYSFFIIKTFLTQPNNSSLTLEDKMSIFVIIIDECDCKLSTKFQLFNLLSEYLIELSKSYIHPESYQEKNNNFHSIFFKFWFTPLISYLNQNANSEIKLSNISLFFNCMLSKTAKMQLYLTSMHMKCNLEVIDSFPKCIISQICDYIAFIPKFEDSYFYSEEANVNLIYNDIISKIESSSLTECKIDQCIPLKTIKYPILMILYIWKAYLYFNCKEKNFEFDNNKLSLLYSIVVYVSAEYISTQRQDLKDKCLEKLFTFSAVSTLWISLNYNCFCKDINIYRIIEKMEFFFKRIDNKNYLFICKTVKNRLEINNFSL